MVKTTDVDLSGRSAQSYVVVGTGLWPRIREGEVIYVTSGAEPQPGDEVVVTLLDGTVIVKEFLASSEDGRVALGDLMDEDCTVFERAGIRSMQVICGTRHARAAELAEYTAPRAALDADTAMLMAANPMSIN